MVASAPSIILSPLIQGRRVWRIDVGGIIERKKGGLSLELSFLASTLLWCVSIGASDCDCACLADKMTGVSGILLVFCRIDLGSQIQSLWVACSASVKYILLA